MRLLSFLAIFVILACPGLPAQTVEGRLLELGSDQPIILAQVFLLTVGGEIADQTFTDERGFFSLSAREAGSFFVQAERIGYEARVDGVFDLGEGGVLSVEFRLPRNPVALDTLHVSAERRSARLVLLGFYDRMKYGFGKFLTPEEIARRSVFGATDLLRNIPRVRIRQRQFGGSEVLIRSSRGLCSPNVVIDGNVVFWGQPARLDEVVQPHEIEAIEVYRGGAEIPLQFGGASSTCGAILIWTR